MTLPAVVLNGALGVDFRDGSRFHRAAFARADAQMVLEAFASVGLAPVTYVDHQHYEAFLSTTPSTHPSHAASLVDSTVDDLERVVADEPVLGYSMIGVPFADAEAAAAAIDGRAEIHLDRSLDYDGLATLTVAPKGQSKWDGVLSFCAAHGIDDTRILALADGPNDIELLEGAAVRLVPEVAHPRALERADHVIPAAAEGGWAHVLDHLG